MGEKIRGMEGLEPVPEKNKKIIVEVGTGTARGPFFKAGKRQVSEDELYMSVDKDKLAATLTNEIINRENRNSNHFALRADAKKLPFADGTVDELIFTNVFGDPRTDREEEMLKEAARVLKSGGKITITENNTPDLVPDEMRVRRYIDGSLRLKWNNFFEMFGLRVESINGDKSAIEQYHQGYNFKIDTRGDFQLVLIKE